MSAANSLANLQQPPTVRLGLRTLTPLYTGGIGQWGDQIQPAGILGSIRHFSILVADALGNQDFDERFWGKKPSGDGGHHAKGVAIRLDTSKLEGQSMPNNVRIPTNLDRHMGWYFNQAFTGDWALSLTPRSSLDNVQSAHDWQTLLLALR
ncbi:MAG: hypothetical protein WCP34_15260, partial [Pseudomonadota bacterium]